MDQLIKRGTLILVKKDASLPVGQLHLRERLGKVVEDSLPNAVVFAEFQEGKTEQLHRDVLTVKLDRDDPKWSIRKAAAMVHWSNPVAAAKGKARLSAIQWTNDRRRRHIARMGKYPLEVIGKVENFIQQNPTMTSVEIANLTGTDATWIEGRRETMVKRGLVPSRRKMTVVDRDKKAQIEAVLREQAAHRTIKGDIAQAVAKQFNTTVGIVNGVQAKAGIRFQKHRSDYLPFANAREWAHSSGITRQQDWITAILPPNIPKYPEDIYDKDWVDWFDWLGREPWVRKETVTAYLQDLQKLLPDLSDADVLKLLREAQILNRLGNIRFTGGTAGILQALRQGEIPDVSAERLRIVDDEDIDDIVDSDYASPQPDVNPHLPDLLSKLQAGANTIQYVKDSQLAALRAKWFRDGVAPQLSDEGGELFQEIKREFNNEVAAVNALETPWWRLQKAGVLLPPSPMQKYVAWRLKQDRVLGNWSGTGAGKTDSAGLASYVIDSRLTVVLAANSTLLGWKKQLEETFPNSKVFLRWDDVEYGQGCFLILNYENFQTGTGMAQKIVALQPDMIVLDEIQYIKQRVGDASNRSMTVRDMLEQLPQIYVLGMTATPVINELREGISLLEAIKRATLDLKTRATVNYALDLYAALRRAGVRYIPKYEQTEEKIIVTERCDDLNNSLLQANDILRMEQMLLGPKLEKVRDKIQRGTVLYLEYTTGLAEQTRAFVHALGYTVGEYIGDTDSEEREEIKRKFIAGEIDVLIGSRAISVGVDGLQYRANRLILLSLPWTHAAYQQIVGRVYRQGGTGNIEVIIPQIVVGDWSWDKMRYQRIEFKRTLGDCATDGVIPTSSFKENRVELLHKAQRALNKLSKKMNA